MIEQQVNDKEKFTFPFIDNPKITKIVKQIENISKQVRKEKQILLNQEYPKLVSKKTGAY